MGPGLTGSRSRTPRIDSRQVGVGVPETRLRAPSPSSEGVARGRPPAVGGKGRRLVWQRARLAQEGMPGREVAREIPSHDTEIHPGVHMVVAVLLGTRADEGARHGGGGKRFGGEWILVEHQLGLRRRHGGKEIVSHSRGRDVRVDLERPRQLVLLERREEKRAIAQQRAAKRTAALVPRRLRVLLQKKRFGHEARPFIAIEEAPVHQRSRRPW